MQTDRHDGEPGAMVLRLRAAINDHDLEALAGCFATDYRNETPAHPSRGFRGRDQVRRNWEQIFRAVPDITTTLLQTASVANRVWSEWEMRGTRLDGSDHLMRGVTIFDVVDGEAARARFYLEVVDEDAGNIDEAVQRAVTGDSRAAISPVPVSDGDGR